MQTITSNRTLATSCLVEVQCLPLSASSCPSLPMERLECLDPADRELRFSHLSIRYICSLMGWRAIATNITSTRRRYTHVSSRGGANLLRHPLLAARVLCAKQARALLLVPELLGCGGCPARALSNPICYTLVRYDIRSHHCGSFSDFPLWLVRGRRRQLPTSCPIRAGYLHGDRARNTSIVAAVSPYAVVPQHTGVPRPVALEAPRLPASDINTNVCVLCHTGELIPILHCLPARGGRLCRVLALNGGL